MRAKIKKSRVVNARFPALIFSANIIGSSKVCITSVPNKEFFFNPVLSSIIIAETPSRSNVLTLYTKCSSLPPVSPSKIIGLVVTSIISLIVTNLLVRSTNSMSGFPLNVESQSEEIHIASNERGNSVSLSITLVFSTIKPERPFDASITEINGFKCSNLLSVPRLYSGALKSFVISACVSVALIP